MKSRAGQNSLKGSGCLSYQQSGQVRRYRTPEARERAWCEQLIRDMEWAEAYFWRQTPERRKIQKQYMSGKLWEDNDFIFGKVREL